MRSRNIIATPPGATIKEQIEDRGMSQREFAIRMDMSEKHISKLIHGDVRLTDDVALRLEAVLGVPAGFWNKLEAIYREKLARAREENALDEDVELTRKFPYKAIAKLGWVPDVSDVKERVKNLRNFFGVARLGVMEDLRIPGIAYRRTCVAQKNDYTLAVWAQQARRAALEICTSEINLKRLRESLSDIRAMTLELPEDFVEKLRQLLASCGIALVFLPHIDGSFLHGASFLDGKKIVMGLTVRGRDADRFWFSLFHEIYHVLNGDIAKKDGPSDEDEKAADIFARDQLIPVSEFEQFVQQGVFTENEIVAFASRVGIAPGIVVGRLQKENYIEYSWYNHLKVQYVLI